MATFSKSTFDAASYLAFRPSYPKWVYEKVLTYHFGRRLDLSTPFRAQPTTSEGLKTLAVDLGCGPGLSTLPLLNHFDKVIGVDPSSKMVSVAVTPQSVNLPSELRSNPPPPSSEPVRLAQLEYRQGSSEELDWLESESVDLVTAFQAAHWFDYHRFWPQVTRVLKPGGSVCLIGYPDCFLPEYPSAWPLLYHFAMSSKTSLTDSVGGYWQQPGRSIINRALVDIPFPTSSSLTSFMPPEMANQWDQGTALKKLYSTKRTRTTTKKARLAILFNIGSSSPLYPACRCARGVGIR